MDEKIRTFIAVKIYPEQRLIDQLRDFKRLFKDERINWVPEDNFHLTLRFLGDTTLEQLAVIHSSLEQLSNQLSAFDFQISGTGTFGSKGNPRVLFVNIQFPEDMRILVKKIEEAVVSAGFCEELKPFRPHLTLGRIKHLENRTRFLQIVNEIPQLDYQIVRVSEFILFQSILQPRGPIYKPLKTYLLR